MLQYLPNSLTFLRLILAVPLGYLVLEGNYTGALGVGLVAGISDALDGFFARKLGAFSRFGAALDPIADKVLITVTFVCMAQVELIPWYLAAVVIARDAIIVTGAAAYYQFVGPFEFAATTLSKANMLIQIAFCLLVLFSQTITGIPPQATLIGTVAVLFIAATSGFNYVMSWTIKALQERKSHD